MPPSTPCKTGFALFFWTFNLTLLFIIYVGFLPLFGPSFFRDALAGELPLDFLLPFLGLVGVPTTCTALGVLRQQRRSLSLVHLFYGVEAPLLGLLLLRFFLLRELTPATTLILATAAWSICFYGRRLVVPTRPLSGGRAVLELIGSTLMLAIALYVGLVAAFFLPPLIWGFLLTISFGLGYLLLFGLVLFPFLVVLVGGVSGPLGMTLLYLRAGWQQFQEFQARYGRVKATGVTAAILLIWVLALGWLQVPPHSDLLPLLQQATPNPQSRAVLVQRSPEIRQILLNAYLASYRYLGNRREQRTIYSLYRNVMDLPQPLAEGLQESYNFLISPFLYNELPLSSEAAAAQYAAFFDTPIQRAELPAIQRAIQSTFDRDGAKAGLLDINQQRVWLAQQAVTVTPHGDWAEVEVAEVYQNQTPQQQEILYYFSLPETAVITGLWLGETGDRAQRFPFVVAPRGAAQQVYTEEVNRRVDPALLEQVGPRNYRLRAFPIPPQNQGEMHLWLTYQVLQQDGSWPLPQLSQKRNLFWTPTTQRLQNGRAVRHHPDAWLPALLPAQPARSISHTTVLGDGHQILAQPLTALASERPQNQRLALIIDGSYSMNAQRQALTETWQWLRQQVLPANDLDLYLTAAQGGEPRRLDNPRDLDLTQLSFYGTLQGPEMLSQFTRLRGDTPYDGILVLTDAGSYELGADQPALPTPAAPLWLVHLGGMPSAYDDATLEAIQASGGGVTTQVQEALQRLVTQKALGGVNVVDGYVWRWQQTPANLTDPSSTATDEFSPLAARQLVLRLSQQGPLDAAKLDALHAIARQEGIVTPYSSMIVLVNQRQRQALQQAEQQRDRFEREIEDKETLPQPGSLVPELEGVPEPATWMLLLCLGLFLLVSHGRSRLRSTQI